MKIRRLTIALFVSFVLAGCSSNDSGTTVSITNNELWRDTANATIQAHDGIVRDGDTYYWYGTDYADAQLSASDLSIHFKAIKCYSSKDLLNWTFERDVLTPSSSSLLAYAAVTAPSVIYNKSTGMYVMWLHYKTLSTAKALSLVATCDTPDGDFVVANSVFASADHDGNSDYMHSLFVDEDGSAYVVTSAMDEEPENYWLYIQKLTDDYLGIDADWNDDGTDDEGIAAELFPNNSKVINRTALFHDGDYYYLMFSTGEHSGLTYYAFAQSISGPWSGYQSIGTTASSYGEMASVFQIRGSDANTWMVMMNNWTTSDYSESKYIMLPLSVSGKSLDFDYHSTVTVNAATGVVTGN